MPQVVPTGRESPVDAEEIIVSKTNLEGCIAYASDVFLRVAHMSERAAIVAGGAECRMDIDDWSSG